MVDLISRAAKTRADQREAGFTTPSHPRNRKSIFAQYILKMCYAPFAKDAAIMAKKVDLGTKRVCPECEAKFYDLAKDPALCPICATETAWDQFQVVPILPSSQLPPEPKDDDDDEDEDAEAKPEVDEDDIDEEEEAAKELELDGDDVAVIGGAKGDDDQPGYDGGYSEDEDEDADAALVADDDDNEMPPPDDDSDLDDDEEIEI